MAWRDKRVELDAAGRIFREALAHAERMETQTQFAWDAVARARLRFGKAREKHALSIFHKPRTRKS